MHQGMTDAQCTGDLTLGVGALISLNKPMAQTQNALGTWGEVGEQGLHLLVGVRVTHRRSRLRGSFFGPNLGYRNQRRANTQVVNLILVGILLFMLVIQLPLTAYALGAQVDVTLVICLTVSILIMFLGNYLGKLRRNFWVGIRTPWTLASDIVWERTHRLGGWLFVPVGFISLITSFFPPLRYIGLFVPLIVVVIVLVVYSSLTSFTLSVAESRYRRPLMAMRECLICRKICVARVSDCGEAGDASVQVTCTHPLIHPIARN